MTASASATFSMVLAQLLDQNLSRNKLTYKEFFEKSKISQATWSRIVRGRSQFSIEDLRQACFVLNVRLTNLIETAELISAQLPKEEVQVVPPKTESIAAPLLAGAALGFLISRILK